MGQFSALLFAQQCERHHPDLTNNKFGTGGISLFLCRALALGSTAAHDE
jgi:hypothetical protein